MNKRKPSLGGGRPREQSAPELERLKAAAAGRKVRLNANVPAGLYGRYKVAVEQMGLTVTAVIVQHMHDFLAERE